MRVSPRLVVCLSIIAGLLLSGTGMVTATAAVQVPLDYRAYDGWNAIRGTVISDDGRYAAYALVPEDGDPTLIVRDFQTGTDRTESRGIDPAFSADSRYVVFTLRAPNAEIHAAKRAHKKPEESPKNGIGILDLASGAVATVERVKSFKLPHDVGSDTLAYALESPSPAPSAAAQRSAITTSPQRSFSQPSTRAVTTPAATVPSVAAPPTVMPTSTQPATASPPATAIPLTASAPVSPSPSATASPDDLHKKDEATTLIVRDLPSSTEIRIPNVADYAIAHDGAFVAYARQSADGALDGVSARASAGGQTFVALSGRGHYKNLTFAPRRELLAFVTDRDSFAAPAPHYALYQSDLADASAAGRARPLVDTTTAGFATMPPSANGKLRYSKDGARLFFGTAPAPTPVPAGTPDPMKVDIWNWQDIDLQSMQRKDADDERKRTFAAVAATDGTRAVQLASGTVRAIESNENPAIALGIDDVRYRKAESWDLDFNDIYGVSLADGSRRLLIRKQRDEGPIRTNPRTNRRSRRRAASSSPTIRIVVRGFRSPPATASASISPRACGRRSTTNATITRRRRRRTASPVGSTATATRSCATGTTSGRSIRAAARHIRSPAGSDADATSSSFRKSPIPTASPTIRQNRSCSTR